jgi:hypothetical protein
LGRVCLFKRKLIGTILVALFFFGLVFAPFFWPATLVASETIEGTAPLGSRSFFARQQIVIRAF